MMKVESQSGFVQSNFLVEGHVDDMLLLHYDNEKGRAELQGLWADMSYETWDTETTFLKEKEKTLRRSMAEIMALQGEEKKALHSLQEDVGCEIHEDDSTSGFWDFHYDGELFLSYHSDTQRWTMPQSSAHSLAMEIKNSWDEDGIQDKKSQVHEEADCLQKLQCYLINWKKLESTVPPLVNVTLSKASEGKVTLTCSAFGFYPPSILVTWFRDKEPLSQDSQQSGAIQPHGNATYWTWVATRIPQGEEQKYTCSVEHGGKNSTYPVTPGEAPAPWRLWCLISAIIFGCIICVAFVFWCYKRRRHQMQRSRDHEAKSSDYQMVPLDDKGGVLLEVQSSREALGTDSTGGA